MIYAIWISNGFLCNSSSHTGHVWRVPQLLFCSHMYISHLDQ